MERAKYYLKRSAEIGYEIPEYKKYEVDSAAFCLHSLLEWKEYMAVFKFKSDSLLTMLAKTTAQLNDTTLRANKSPLDNKYWKELASKSSSTLLINKIKQFNDYPSVKGKNFWTLYNMRVNDKLTVPFLVHIPKNYDPKQKSGIIDFNKNKSGAIIANVKGNTIDIQTSRVKRIKIYISADMFDLDQQIKLIVNGKQYLNFKIDPDKNSILEEFLKTKDRVFIVANKIEFTIE